MKSKNKNPLKSTLKAHLASNLVAGSNPVFPTDEVWYNSKALHSDYCCHHTDSPCGRSYDRTAIFPTVGVITKPHSPFKFKQVCKLFTQKIRFGFGYLTDNDHFPSVGLVTVPQFYPHCSLA
jgi:hypothetical protein